MSNEKIETLDQFFAEAKRTGLTAATLAAALSSRPEFADCLPKQPSRSAKDYAIEHAGYMATTAKLLLDAINEEDRARMVHDERGSELSGRVLDSRMASRGEMVLALRTDIYEFEKRRDRAAII